jgi:hypothetical protein
MKIAACYSVFNGRELLNPSIAQIVDYVDLIIIAWQNTGWNGKPDPGIEYFINQYKGRDKFITVKFDCNPNINPKANEILKHNLLLDTARENGCTHFFMSATDHFYLPEQFEKWKEHAADYDVTFTSMFTYYKYPTWQLTPIEDYLMPWIMKIHTESKFQKLSDFPAHIDPSIKLNTCSKFYIYNENQIMLHHMSMVRYNMADKFNNSASRFRWGAEKANEYLQEFLNYDIETNPGIQYFQGRKIKVVPNYFTLDTFV